MKKIGILFLLFSLTFTLFSQTEFIYSVNGEKLNFKVRNDVVMIKAKADKNITLLSKQSHFSSIYAITDAMIIASIDTTNIKKEFFKQDKTVSDVSYMLEYTDGVLQIPEKNIFIKCKEGYTIETVLNRSGVNDKIIKTEIFNSNHKIYSVFFDANTEDIITISQNVYETGLCEFATPSFTRLLKPFNTYEYLQWGLNNTGQQGGTVGYDINVTSVWNYTSGQGIKIAIIDEGVDLTHPDLAANIMTGYDATGYGSNGNPANNDAHGTACAGIAAAVNNSIGTKGVAYNSKIVPVRIAYGQYSHWVTNDNWITSGIRYAWQTAQADVLSNSWGGGSPSQAITAEINDAITLGRNGKGCVVVFATGNNNSSVQYPASLNSVIAVGAMSQCGQRKNPASCDGENWWGSNYGNGLDVVAPGVKIYVTDIQGNRGYNTQVSGDYYDSFNGTSSACPHVSGVAALILSANPLLTQQEVRNIIESTCRKIGNYSYNTRKANGTWNNEMGYGLIDANAAFNAAISKLTISGASNICTEATVYTLNNLPSHIPVTWTTSVYLHSNSAPSPQFTPNSPTNHQCIISNKYKYPMVFILSASINGVVVATKEIVTEASPKQLNGTYYQPNVSGFSTPKAIPEGTVYLMHSNLAIFKFTNVGDNPVVFAGTIQPTSWNYNSSTKTLNVVLPFIGGGHFPFDIGEKGTCGYYQLNLYSSGAPTRLAEIKEGVVDIEIFDVFSGSKVFNKKDIDISTFNIDQLSLKNGYYIIQVKSGEHTINEKIQINK